MGEVLSKTGALTHEHHQVALGKEDYASHLPSWPAKESSVSALLLSHATALCINVLRSGLN